MPNSIITRRASLSTAPSTWNAEARTIDVTFSTFADVQRPGYVERVTQEGLDLSRLIGAHVLKDHNASSIDNVLGVVVAARKDGTATLRLNDRPEIASIVGAIAKGDIRHLSFSANVSAWRDSVDPKSGARIKTAVRWTPHELSFVAVPADPGATTRSITMPELDNAPEQSAQTTERVTRNQAIRTLCRDNGMTQEFTDSLTDGDGDLITARAAINAEIIARAPKIRATVGVDHTDPAKSVERRANALYARGAGIQPDEASKEHYHDSIPDVARWALQASGQPHRGNDADLVSRAMHTTGDFPLILENVANKSLEAAYSINRSPIVTKLGRQKTLSTFHPASILRVGEIGPLEDLSESGEFKHTTRTEEKNTLALETGGRRIDYSGKLLVQDDVGALVDAPTQFAQSATAWENAKVLALFAANPVLGDGKQWFDATRAPVQL
jgi:phage head maturation protease